MADKTYEKDIPLEEREKQRRKLALIEQKATPKARRLLAELRKRKKMKDYREYMRKIEQGKDVPGIGMHGAKGLKTY